MNACMDRRGEVELGRRVHEGVEAAKHNFSVARVLIKTQDDVIKSICPTFRRHETELL